MAARENLPVDFLGVHRRSDPADAGPFLPRYSSPPVAMSLRTRESSSLALKHIFDQINSSAESGQHMDSQLVRASETRDERDGQLGTAKGGRSSESESELEAPQRIIGGVEGSKNQAVEERNLFPFKGYADVEGKGRAWQLDSEKDLKYDFRMPERPRVPLPPRAEASMNNESRLSGGLGGAAPSLQNPRKKLPDLDLSFRKALPQDPSSAAIFTQTGFGSPISTSNNSSDLLSNSTSASWSAHAMQPAFLPQAVSRPGTSNSLNRQPTAQLTIFYSGMVNVYDDVPSDKANAIMLLAGNGKSWSTNVTNPPPPERERTPQVTPNSPPAAVAALQPVPAATVATSTPTNPRAPVQPLSPPPPTTSRISSTSVQAAAPRSPSVTAEAKSQTITTRPHASIELPHARKASLARFLEKRKDRVQVKPQVTGADQGKENDAVSTERPCSPKKQRIARSRSPSPTKSNRCSSPSKAPALTAAASSTLPTNPRRFMD